MSNGDINVTLRGVDILLIYLNKYIFKNYIFNDTPILYLMNFKINVDILLTYQCYTFKMNVNILMLCLKLVFNNFRTCLGVVLK